MVNTEHCSYTKMFPIDYLPQRFSIQEREWEPSLRVYFFDIPYNLRLQEGVYTFEYEGTVVSYRFKRITTDKYEEEEPLHEGNVSRQSLIYPIMGDDTGHLERTYTNVDPKRRGYEHKYMRCLVVCYDPLKNLKDDEKGFLVDTTNYLLKQYISYSGDSTVGELPSDELELIYEIAWSQSGDMLLSIAADLQQGQTAIRLTEDSCEEFQEKVLTSDVSKSTLFRAKAKHLLENHFYSASILYSEKAVECILDELIKQEWDKEKGEILSYLNRDSPNNVKDKIHTLSFLVGKKLKELDTYRNYHSLRGNHRDRLVHEDHEVTQKEASLYVRRASEFIQTLAVNLMEGEMISPDYEFYNGKTPDITRPDVKKNEEKIQRIA